MKKEDISNLIGLLLLAFVIFCILSSSILFATGRISWECTCTKSELHWISNTPNLANNSDANLYHKETECLRSVCKIVEKA